MEGHAPIYQDEKVNIDWTRRKVGLMEMDTYFNKIKFSLLRNFSQVQWK